MNEMLRSGGLVRRGLAAGGMAVVVLLLCSCAASEADAKVLAGRYLDEAVTSVTAQVQSMLRSSRGSALVADPQSLATSLHAPDFTGVRVLSATAAGKALVAELKLTSHVDTGGGLWAQTAEATRCLRVSGAPSADVVVTSSVLACPAA